MEIAVSPKTACPAMSIFFGWFLSESLVPVTIKYWAYIFGLMNAKLNSSGATPRGAGSASHVPVSARPLPLGLSSCAHWLVPPKWGESGWLRNEFPHIPTYSRLFPDSQEKRGISRR
jgi:hypothetical protein